MEGDAGTGRLNPTDADDTPEQSVAVSPDEPTEPDGDAVETPETEVPVGASRRQPRLGRGWMTAICAVLVLLTAAGVVAGYLALRSHNHSEELTRAGEAAVAAAKECVRATHAPDTKAMATSQAKIMECSIGDFGAQAALYSGVLVDAYRAANVTVQVADMRAAVERHNDDGTVDVLVGVRTKVSNSESEGQEQGYRLRLKMAPEDGTYKVAQLDQVTS